MTGLEILSREQEGRVAYFELSGYVDASTCDDLKAEFAECFSRATFCFVIKVMRLQYISSAGAGAFISAAEACQNNDGNVVLVRPSRGVMDILELLGAHDIFPIFDTTEEARKYFAERPGE